MHNKNDHRYNNCQSPGALGKPGYKYNHRSGTGHKSAQAVYEHFIPITFSLHPDPSDHHPDLGQGKGQEYSDGIKRDQIMGFRLKNHQQKCRHKKNEQNPIGKAKPCPSVHELAGHGSISSQDGQQRRQTIICSICRQQ